MSIETDLKKDGIEVIEKLDTLSVNSIAETIAKKLSSSFPLFFPDSKGLFRKLSRLNMYTAKMPEGMSEANYFYKNSSIYFNEHIPFEDIEEFAIHECIHYLQEIKDRRNYLTRMGLCDFTEFKIYGMGLNEAAVQFITSKVINIPTDYVKYFGIDFPTNSPSYYPLECNLINQMAYLIGEYILFDSTFNSNDNFRNTFISCSSSKTFYKIQYLFDVILYAEENIIKLNNKYLEIDERNRKSISIAKKIEAEKKKIYNSFFETQNLIFTEYFNKQFKNIKTLEDLDNYRRKLSGYKKLIGTSNDYSSFDDFYTEKMSALEHKNNVLENGGIETYLYSDNKKSGFLSIFSFIRKLFSNKSSYESNNEK